MGGVSRWLPRIAAFFIGFMLCALPGVAATDGGFVGYRPVAGDYNGDGVLDLLIQPLAGSHGAAEFIAYPDGNFGAPLASWPDVNRGTDWNADAHRIVVGDWNGDGRADLLLQGAAGLASQTFLAAPDGRFPQIGETLPASLGGLDPSLAAHALVVGDFNGDGRDDLFLQANTFVGSDGIALADAHGGFTTLAASWGDGTLGLAWSADRVAPSAGDFTGDGHAELLLRAPGSAGAAGCCRIVRFGPSLQPAGVAQSWAAGYLGIDWDPAATHAIVGDLNGDGRDDLVLQPVAPGGTLYLLLANPSGEFTAIAERWSSDRGGFDWSAESYELVAQPGIDGKPGALLLIPKLAGLPYRRAQFSSGGRLVRVVTLAGPPSGALGVYAGAGGGGGHAGAGRRNAPGLGDPVPTGNTPGAMGGSGSVASGTATYSIPIQVPPGRAGMAPQLALEYASNGGDGHEGVGWSLSGFSAIYRCPATWASDGHTSGTTFATGDRFCMDGHKLMLASGTYGASSSVYHAEVNGFATVTANASQGTGPQSFTVVTADGHTLTYGGSAGGRLLGADSSVFTWALTKSVDQENNEIDYHYTNAAGEYYPSEIDYTLGGGSGATRKVVFGWTPRTDHADSDIVHYLAGTELQTTELLHTITTYVGGTEERQYTVDYKQSPATGRPLIDWVQACAWDAAGNQSCLNPVTFTYQGQHAPALAMVAGDSVGLANPGGNVPPCVDFDRYQVGSANDLNGDGRVDLRGFYMASANDKAEFVQWGGSNGFSAPAAGTNTGYAKLPNDGYQWNEFSGPIDFNLDGKTDLIMTKTAGPGHPTSVYFASGAGDGSYFAPTPTGVSIPANGQNDWTWPTKYFHDVLVADVNGDGKPDLITAWKPGASTYKLQVYLAQSTGNDPSYSAGTTTTFSNEITYARPIDFNADGKTDLLIHYAGASYFRLLESTQQGSAYTFTNVQTSVPVIADPNDQNGSAETPVIADVNGDSLPDIIEAEKNANGDWHWMIYLNKGDGSFSDAFDTGVAVATTTYQAETWHLNNFVQVFHDPDGHDDLLIPTARVFEHPTLTQQCEANNNCSWPSGVDACGNSRTEFSPTAEDGYDWTLYRSALSGAGVGVTVKLQDPIASLTGLAGGDMVMDENGDGLNDLVAMVTHDDGYYTQYPSTRGGEVSVYRLSYGGGSAGGPMPDLIKTASNGFGITDTFSYLPTTNDAVYTRTNETDAYPYLLFRSTMQVVASLTQTNRSGGLNATEYSYKDAVYDVAGRGFMGFREVSADSQPGDGLPPTTTITDYDHADPFPLFGRMTNRQTALDDAPHTVFATSAESWHQPIAFDASGRTRYVVYTDAQSGVSKDPADGGLIETTSQTQSGVDGCGNPSATSQAVTTYGTGGAELAVEQVDSTFGYSFTSPQSCASDLLQHSSVTTTRHYEQAPATSDTLTVTTDPIQYHSGTQLVQSKTVTATHAGTQIARTWNYGYDGFGNRTSSTESVSDGTPARTVTWDYGSDGYFARTETADPAGADLVTHTAYDPDTGKKTAVTDPSGCVTAFAYDAFGRSAGGEKCGESAVAVHRYDPDATYSCPTHGVYVEVTTQPGYPGGYRCYDAFGDVLQASGKGFDGSWVDVDTAYDALGHTVSKTVPHERGGSGYATLYSGFDALGRPAQEQEPTFGGGTRTLAMAYAGFTTSYTDTAGQVTHQYKRTYDGLGKGRGSLIRAEQQKSGGGWIHSTYRYDAGGNIIQAVDPKGNTIAASYDGFGDKLSLADPDQGASNYTYDDLGDLKSETNARGQTVSYLYDALGRKTEEDDPADGRVIAWTYDAAPYGLGKVASETVKVGGSPVYTRLYGYDTAGRPSASKITEADGTSYLEGMDYDGYGRLAQRAYPALGGDTDQAPATPSAEALPGGPVATGSAVQLAAADSDPDGWGLSYRWSQQGGSPATASISGADSPTATALLPAPGTYTFAVVATDGFQSKSATVTVRAKDLPGGGSTPTATPATSYDGTVQVNWSGIGGATSYKLQENGGPGDPTTYNASGTSKAVTGRAVGTYTFRVKGCNDVGCGSYGGASDAVSVAAPPPPSEPNVGPNPSPDGTYTVSWDSAPGAPGGSTYKVEENPGSGWNSVQNSSALQYGPVTQTDNGTWQYRVLTCDADTGCGTPSAVASETVAFVPATPGGLTGPAGPIAPNGPYQLSWDATAHAASYDLALDGTNPTQTGITGTSVSETAPNANDVTLDWRVRACGAGGCSAWSAPVEVHTVPVGGGGGFGGCGSTCAPQPASGTGAGLAAGGTGALIVDYTYNAQGYVEGAVRDADGAVYAEIAAEDARGQVSAAYEGGADASTAAVSLTRGYDPATGLLANVSAAGSASLAQQTYQFDGFGNLAERQSTVTIADSPVTETETAGYDALNRLTGTTLTLQGLGTSTTTYTYDDAGNMTSRSDRGSYTYGQNGAGPHGVSSVSDGSTFAYDADGEMTDDDGTTLAWTAFGKAATVTQAGGNHLAFTYGPDDARIEKDATVGNQSEQVLYFSGAERLTQGPYNQIRRTVTLADLSVIDTGGAGGHVLYPVTDNLGSTIALGNADGSLAQGMDYGPFGNRTSAGWTGPLGQNQAININTTETDRGYTGQEELDTVDLVDYNARLYDPALGRFLSVDPLVAHPESTQGINPYSYVENNPLNATDPTGEYRPEARLCSRNNTCAAMTASALNGTMAYNPDAAMSAQATVTQTSIATGEVVATYSASGASAWTLANTAQLAQQFEKAANSMGNTNINDGTSLGNQSSSQVIAAQASRPSQDGTTTGGASGPLTTEARKKAYDDGLAYDRSHGIIPKGHHFVYNRKFAVIHRDNRYKVDKVKTFDTEGEAMQFIYDHEGENYSMADGLTTVGSNTSTIYASATDPGRFIGYGEYPYNFPTPASHVEFIIAHELQHQLGVGATYKDEIRADMNARELIKKANGG